ncbi:dapper homolog 3-like [Canis lupus familiaris]|uniref:dapper homolog 3-like n=1 Tax=Canis lupus familiaris TaxID=9615 RepID=UPI000DC68608|nr:dapper homolog 3-like [Canis lupus familiaris]
MGYLVTIAIRELESRALKRVNDEGEASEQPGATRTHNRGAEVSNSNSGPPRRPARKPPTARVARGGRGARRRESRAELEAGPVHLHANTQNAFPRTPLLLMEALSLEPWKVWSTYFAPSSQLWELPPRARGARSPGLRAGWWRPPALPRQADLGIQPARGSIPRPAGDKAPWPAGGAPAGALGDSLGCGRWGCSRPRDALRRSPGPPVPPAVWGLPGRAGPPRACPPPLPPCGRFPEPVTSRSPGHKAQRVAVWEKGWTVTSSPQLSRARSPLGSARERGAAAAAPEARPAPGQDPGPSLALRAGRRSQATSGDLAHQSGAPKGNRRPLDLRVHTTGWGARVCTPRPLTPPSRPLAATLGGEGGTAGAGLLARRFVCIGVKVQEEVQPLPSFLRSEHTEAGAAAPPLRRRLRPAPGRAHPAAATARSLQRSPSPPPARLRDQARAAAPVRAPPPPPSPFVSSAPAPPPRLALCRGRSARPQRARESRGARAHACAADPSASSPRARAPFGCAPAPPGGREGRWQARLREGRTSLLAYPPEVDLEGEAGRRRGERSARSSRGGGSYVGGGAPCGLDSPIRAGGVCARRTCETTEPRAGTCGECRSVRCARLLAA